MSQLLSRLSRLSSSSSHGLTELRRRLSTAATPYLLSKETISKKAKRPFDGSFLVDMNLYDPTRVSLTLTTSPRADKMRLSHITSLKTWSSHLLGTTSLFIESCPFKGATSFFQEKEWSLRRRHLPLETPPTGRSPRVLGCLGKTLSERSVHTLKTLEISASL